MRRRVAWPGAIHRSTRRCGGWRNDRRAVHARDGHGVSGSNASSCLSGPFQNRPSNIAFTINRIGSIADHGVVAIDCRGRFHLIDNALARAHAESWTPRAIGRSDRSMDKTSGVDTCSHLNLRGPDRLGVTGAFCRDCGEQVECPHPPHAVIRDHSMGTARQSRYESRCGWCGVVVGG